MSAHDLINWGELSRQLAGNRSSITRDRIPKKHQKRIDELLRVVKEWQEKIKK